ncbi:VOC family protein [[Eubacterium] cellulosolvens]
MIKRVSHIGVVVNNLDELLTLFEKSFNLKPSAVKDAMEGKLRIAFLPVGDDEIELIQPQDPDIRIGGVPQRYGQHIHHISLVTDNIESDFDLMKSKGVDFAGEPKIGAHGVKIVFTRPETTGGIAIELCEEG